MWLYLLFSMPLCLCSQSTWANKPSKEQSTSFSFPFSLWLLLLLRKSFVTLITLILFLPSMNSHMCVCVRALSHLITLIWSFLSMTPYLIYKMVISFVTLIKNTAFRWVLFPLWVFMWRNKNAIPIGILAALSAFVWFLPSMNPHMNCKMGLWCKNFAILLTTMITLPNVTHHMVTECE